MLKLPLLEPHQQTLERCVYCPKLSRAACPVSTVEANETVTPWGKMSMAYFAGRGDVPIDAVHADSAWACTGCFACRERCDHKNEVATVLFDARAEYLARGVAPSAAASAARAFAAHEVRAARAAAELEGEREARKRARVAVLVGCSYLKRSPEVARDAMTAVEALAGEPVRPVKGCCGLPLLHAGDRTGFVAAARRLASEVGSAAELVVVDPGCARALAHEYPRVGVAAPDARLFVDLAASALDRLEALPFEGPVRYHDPCQLGRGLGRFDEPRKILARITGQAPAEFVRSREHAECSGAGGLLPLTRPASSEAIADTRIAEHRARGGGLLVTACGESLRRFRSRGERAEDLVSLVARALAPR